MALMAPVTAAQGERIIAYVDHLGRLEGHIHVIYQNGFRDDHRRAAQKRDKLAAQGTWLANRNMAGPARSSPPRPYRAAQPGWPPGACPTASTSPAGIIDVSQ